MPTIITGVIAVAIFTQLFKALLENLFNVASTDRKHDPLIWTAALTISLVGYIGNAALNGPLTGPIFRDACGDALLAMLSALGTYHFTTHEFFNGTTTALISGVATTLREYTPTAVSPQQPITINVHPSLDPTTHAAQGVGPSTTTSTNAPPTTRTTFPITLTPAQNPLQKTDTLSATTGSYVNYFGKQP